MLRDAAGFQGVGCQTTPNSTKVPDPILQNRSFLKPSLRILHPALGRPGWRKWLQLRQHSGPVTCPNLHPLLVTATFLGTIARLSYSGNFLYNSLPAVLSTVSCDPVPVCP